MSWGTELWDQYEKVCAHTDHGIEFVRRAHTFVEKRIHVEQSYAKDLRRLVKQFRKRDEEQSNYTAMKALSQVVHETNDLAGQRELIAESLEAEVLEPLKGLARDVAVERKKHLAQGSELLRQLKASMDSLERCKKQYEKASEDAENALSTLTKADNDPNSTKAKIDKLTTTLRQKEATAEEGRNTYILQLETTNGHRRQHFDQPMPNLFSELQDMNACRINKYKELVASYAECHRSVFPVINTCLNNITGASNSIDADKDNQQLVEDSKTGFPIPANVQFEEYQGKLNQSGKQKKPVPPRKKGNEPREDYGHLPPEQQKKKLQKKIDQLEAAINKAHSDMAAMQKMQQIYTDNPKLGDAHQVAASLEQTNGKIAELQGELEKYQGWLVTAKESHKGLAVGQTATKFSPMFGRKDKKKGKEKAPNGAEEPHKEVESPGQEHSPPVPAYREPEPEFQPPPAPRASGGRGMSEEWEEGGSDEEEDEDVVIRSGTMLYDFNGQSDDEMSVPKDTRVDVMEDLGDGWLRVRKGKEEGYVPSQYVEIN